MVPKKGLEPPHPCEYVDLNHARLPIPPLRHETQVQRTAEPAASLSLANAGLCVKFWQGERAGKAGANSSGHGVRIAAYTSLASSRISVLLAKSLEIGHPALASAAALAKTSGEAPGTLAVVVSAMGVTAKPPSTLPSEIAAWHSIFLGRSGE